MRPLSAADVALHSNENEPEADDSSDVANHSFMTSNFSTEKYIVVSGSPAASKLALDAQRTISRKATISRTSAAGSEKKYRDVVFDPIVFDVLAIEPEAVADELALVDSQLFRQIGESELRSVAWTGPNKFTVTPNIVNMTNGFNHVALWISQEIVDCRLEKRRLQKIKHFIAVASACLSLRNFNGLKSILTGLECSPVHRLKSTWANVGRKEKAALLKFQKLMSPENNWMNYRRRLAEEGFPIVPYLGVYLMDLTFMVEARKTEKDEALIARDNQINNILAQFAEFQARSQYDIKEIPSIRDVLITQKYIDELQLFWEDMHYAKSYQIEPKTGIPSGAPSGMSSLKTSSTVPSTETLAASRTTSGGGSTGEVDPAEEKRRRNGPKFCGRKRAEGVDLLTGMGNSGTLPVGNASLGSATPKAAVDPPLSHGTEGMPTKTKKWRNGAAEAPANYTATGFAGRSKPFRLVDTRTSLHSLAVTASSREVAGSQRRPESAGVASDLPRPLFGRPAGDPNFLLSANASQVAETPSAAARPCSPKPGSPAPIPATFSVPNYGNSPLGTADTFAVPAYHSELPAASAHQSQRSSE